MISKEEYIKLYCDEAMYRLSGVIALSADKLGERMDIDPVKTIRDLDDYGFSDAMRDAPIGPMKSVDILNTRNGRIRSIPVDSAPPIGDDLFDQLLKDFGTSIDPDNFDWGNEDTIR